eukprot:CAMPEP_0116894420 /NCGR_PEP_ID=MMETSP0467-20121206/4193_1 /TAXON_ID=283647 /ORGANISM="Mesodinium pulex, Strain SPMC105" /LENGTH=45 /DNA_ID= /DNA_START= /DNA_END= /DNA_ORIENTATION=
MVNYDGEGRIKYITIPKELEQKTKEFVALTSPRNTLSPIKSVPNQ